MWLARMAVYLGGAGLLGFTLIPWLMRQVHRWPIAQGLVSFAIVVVLLYAWAAEVLGGVAAITGAFLVGLAFARSPLRQEVEHSFSALTYGFFVPLFFVSIGLAANVRDLSGGAALGLVLIAVAVVSKVWAAVGRVVGLKRGERCGWGWA
jgi:Kef-type K+ transport system membrane component KefB